MTQRPDRTGIGPSAATLRAWTREILLPFWAETGLDTATGLWVERVTLDGRPDDPGFRRLRVQARQTYVFALAQTKGLWPADRGTAEAGLSALARLRGRDGGYCTRADASGAIVDQSVLLYDQAFVLLALSACERAGIGGARVEAERLAGLLADRMTHPAGGYLTALGDDAAAPRSQDPHMHLFEAFLSWFAVTGDRVWLDRAAPLADLVAIRFVDDRPHLFERLAGDFSPPPAGPDSDGQPGHFCEWVFLFDWHRRLGGKDRWALAEALYRRALAVGLDTQPGHPLALVDAISAGGEVTRPTKRFWPQTEAIKAANAMARAGHTDAKALAGRLWQSLFRHYLGPDDGVMRDGLAADGSGCEPYGQASSLYHLFVALLDSLDLFHDTDG